MYKHFFKPLLDRLVALILMVILSPIFILICILIIFFYRTNPFFVQSRPGLNEKIFNLIKFKTMTDETDDYGDLIEDYKRRTKLGNFLRNSSLDELPEIFNVLKGEMSLIGPRPLLQEYISKYSDEQRLRHKVRPGITGLAQINGRNLLTWEEKFILDVKYVKNISFITDFKIIVRTIFVLLNAKDINQSDKITMEKFKGSIQENNER